MLDGNVAEVSTSLIFLIEEATRTSYKKLRDSIKTAIGKIKMLINVPNNYDRRRTLFVPRLK